MQTQILIVCIYFYVNSWILESKFLDIIGVNTKKTLKAFEICPENLHFIFLAKKVIEGKPSLTREHLQLKKLKQIGLIAVR